jgi:hypothetical protein
MVPENKQNRNTKKVNFIGLQNNRQPAPDQGSTVGGLLCFPA